MKIRCHANSIRLRVRKSDVEILENNGAVREEILFGPGQALVFELCMEERPAITASLEKNLVKICMPQQLALSWIQSETVGLEHHQALPNGEALHLLIEKDFPCKHQPMEDKSDTFQELA